MQNITLSRAIRAVLTGGLLLGGFSSVALADLSTTGFTVGDLVVNTVSGSTLDQATPYSLQEFSLGNGGASASYVDSLALPQTANGNQSAISGEYGSASDGFLEQSENGAYLTLMGYGVNAANFNSYSSATSSPYGAVALGQSTSITAANQTGSTILTTVPRVVALIGSDGSVDTSTAITGVFNTNNARSVATIDGSAFWISGQGASSSDTATQGVFYTTLGATTASHIFSANDTRAVEIVNNGSSNTLYMSDDNKGNKVANINTLTTSGGGLPTSSTGVTTTIQTPGVASTLGGNQASINLTTALENGVNDAALSSSNQASTATNRVGKFVYLSPEQYFFASVNGGTNNVMYVTDSGQPKNGSTDAAAEGEGGLQKWELVGGVWTLQYDLVAGLNLVNNDLANSATPTAGGVTGLYALTGQVMSNGTVELFATSYGLNELSQSYMYEITDTLSNTTISQAASESFNTIATASSGELFRGIAFAPTVASSVAAVPVPSSILMMLTGLGITGIFGRRSKRA